MGALYSYGMMIGGKETYGAGSARRDVINPATEEAFASVPDGTKDDADAAIAAASLAFGDGRGVWPAMPQRERSRLMLRFCDLLEAHSGTLCDLVRLEAGAVKAIEPVQVHWGLQLTRAWAEKAAHFKFVEALAPQPGLQGGAGAGAVLKEPVGVVAAITAFNFPLLLNLWKIAPALAVGATIVLKPSPYTPLSALVLGRLAAEAGLPDGVLNVVTGDKEVGARLCTHPEVAAVSFTGSTEVGAQVMAQSASTIKRVVLELGGKSANVIFADADLSSPALMQSALQFVTHAGQGCALTTRILVARPLHDELVSAIATTLRQLKIGDPAEPDVLIGPLISDAQRKSVSARVERARASGADIVTGGRSPAALKRGYFYEPTLICGVSNESEIAQEEIFGPVGVVIPFDTEEEAVMLANQSRYGLAGAVWSKDAARALRVARAMRAGTVSINGGNGQLGGSVGDAPFGGYKQSGLGREHGDAGADEFLELKSIDYPIG